MEEDLADDTVGALGDKGEGARGVALIYVTKGMSRIMWGKRRW